MAAQDLLFDQQHFLAVIVNDQPWRAVAKRLVQVIVPQGGHVKVSDLAVILPPDLPAQFLRTEVIADRQSRIAVPYPLPNVWYPPTSPMQFL